MATPIYDDLVDKVPLLLRLDTDWASATAGGHVLTPGAGAVIAVTGGRFGGGCGDFTAPGNDAYAQSDLSADLAVGSGLWALELQYKPTALVAETYFLVGYSSPRTRDVWMKIGSAGQLEAYCLGGYLDSTGRPASLSVNEWHQIRLQRTAVQAELWLNEVLVGTIPTDAISVGMTGPTRWRLGSMPASYATPGSGGRCLIDDVRLTIGAPRPGGLQTAPFSNVAPPEYWPSDCIAWPAGANVR